MFRVTSKDGRSVASDLVKRGLARGDTRGKKKTSLNKVETNVKAAKGGCALGADPAPELAGQPEADGLRSITLGQASDLETEPAAAAVAGAPLAASLPSDFVQEDVFNGGLVEPTAFAFLPDGRILIAEKRGTLRVLIHHCPAGVCHSHPLQTFPGVASGSFTAPDHGDQSHFELELTATDTGGAIDTASVLVQPQAVQLTLATSPAGFQVVYDGATGLAPLTISTIVGSTHTIGAPSPQASYSFSAWSDSGAAEHNITAGPTAATYTATFGQAGAPLAASYANIPPATWAAGETKTYDVAVTNIGTQTWNATGANPVHFGTASDVPHSGWADDYRFTLPGNLAPGQSVTIPVTITAPNTTGTWTLRHPMVKEHVA